jgi:coproporphyrinogen III oxidase
MDIKQTWVNFIHELQDSICAGLERQDGMAQFVEDRWERDEGGGGKTRVIAHGKVFEKGGVNTSAVFGQVTETMRDQLKIDGHQWFACGLSLVIHPYNPFVPTIHANYRMFELYDQYGATVDRWWGGGTDLTPYYLFDEDAIHFHGTLKTVCDRSDPELYPIYKKTCDDYFTNTHRNGERRGIGGIFFDHQRAEGVRDAAFWIKLARDCGDSFLPGYLPIVERRKSKNFTPAQKYWQEIRRGRYVEFNLLHDRGTIFGLKTNGRTESILMSLPPTVRFDYAYQPEAGTDEERLIEICRNPKKWI